jgi:branched-chain amino acid transport system ATP-binding protein
MARDADPALILELDLVSLRFGGVNALADVSCQVKRGELFSIIGPNGAGKTSTLNCISGRYRPDRVPAGGVGAPVMA